MGDDLRPRTALALERGLGPTPRLMNMNHRTHKLELGSDSGKCNNNDYNLHLPSAVPRHAVPCLCPGEVNLLSEE